MLSLPKPSVSVLNLFVWPFNRVDIWLSFSPLSRLKKFSLVTSSTIVNTFSFSCSRFAANLRLCELACSLAREDIGYSTPMACDLIFGSCILKLGLWPRICIRPAF